MYVHMVSIMYSQTDAMNLILVFVSFNVYFLNYLFGCCLIHLKNIFTVYCKIQKFICLESGGLESMRFVLLHLHKAIATTSVILTNTFRVHLQ
jgi:hypothetical protein